MLPLLLAISLAAPLAAAQTQTGNDLRLHTVEQDIVEVLRPGTLDIGNPIEVFAFVLRNVPERARVHPTENYYYFRFVHNGTPYSGNMRLAAADRDQGKVHFTYGESPSDWRPEPDVKHVALDVGQGVAVTRVGALSYSVSHRERTVTFVLNDLASVKPAAGMLRADEKFLGAIFDESGLRFFLVFNTRLKVFHYLLDETIKPSDELVAGAKGGPILIGKRTGFAFYRDGERKILVGVNERESRLNTVLDGPFDQLPENFIEGESLRDAIVAADPSAKGKIDRLGNFTDSDGRFLIHPYMLYRDLADLAIFERCATRVVEARRPLCFVIDDDEAQKRNPRPRALLRR